MSFAIPECSVSQRAVSILTEYGISMLKYMGHNFCHFAMIYTNCGKTVKVYSYGYNHIRSKRSIHAEVDAINNLPPVRRKKKLVKVKLLVIRISRGKLKLAESRCCVRCCESIYRVPPLRGYTIENVAFSNDCGCVEDHHPISLLIDDDYHVSVYYSKRNYHPKIRDRVISHPNPKVKLFIRKKEETDTESESD